MTNISMTIQPNVIGRLFRKPSLHLSLDHFSQRGPDNRTQSVRIDQINRFAERHDGIFGSTLTTTIEGQRQAFKFLRSEDIEQFTEALNKRIAALLGEHALAALDEFENLTIANYPRDSWMARLATLCQRLHSDYHQQRSQWERYLENSLVERVKEVALLHPVTPERVRDRHEEAQLKKRKDFFDRVESNPLTEEQRLGVLRSNDKNMVLAAAGTGKTSVMVAKALDLIDRNLAKPGEILVLAYNRSAAEELEDRLKNKASKSNIDLASTPTISTFHALGRAILREAGISTKLSVFTEDEMKLKQWITKWLEEYLTSNPKRMVDFISLFPEPINPFDFKSQADYERYVRDNELRTLKGELVRGYQELLLSNFMYLNSVDYTYEAPYLTKRRIEIGFDYRPDFHLTDTQIYIEHFGIDREGKTRADIDAEAYNLSMEKKRALHAEMGTTLIETFHYEWVEDCLTQNLQAKLIAAGVKLKPIPPEAILEKLRGQGRIANWSDLLKKALQAIRVERLSKDGILDRLKANKITQPAKLTDLLDALHQAYVHELAEQSAIDFDDMIIRTIHSIRSKAYSPKWKYILVDEFQDISHARMEFVAELISKGPMPSLTVVGDDWQSIYRFSGGKLELTTRFGELVGPHSVTKLQKTFRYNNSIAETAGTFIMENPEQHKKNIKTHVIVNEPQIYLLDDKAGKNSAKGLYDRVNEVVKKIREHDPSGSIAIIARYNFLLIESKNSLSKEQLTPGVEFWTFHRSKGLEADYCIMIGFSQGKNGFPSENKDEAIIEALLPTLDHFPHSEERRLLYVGLTRARKKSYIIADPSAPSSFIDELIAPKYKINIVSKSFQEQHRRIFKCPNCADGYFKLFSGEYGSYYRCSTGMGCIPGTARVCGSCGSPSVDGEDISLCNNPACRHVINICERCGRPMRLRQGKYGRFWGCSGYGLMHDSCGQTRKYAEANQPQ